MRPKIKIEKDTGDLIIEVLGWTGVLLLFLLPFFYYDQLPDKVPSHFNASGDADAYSRKEFIWVPALIGALLYIGVFVLNRFPHLFNYPSEINEQNAERLYRMASKWMRIINLSVLCVFIYLLHSTIQTSLNNQNGLGKYFVIIFILLNVIVSAAFLVMTANSSRKKH